MLSNIAISNRPYDLFGILGFAAKQTGMPHEEKQHWYNHATFQRWRSEITKAGRAVIAGKGQRIVGTLETRSPVDAGTSNPNPEMSVATALFEPIFTIGRLER